MTTSGGEALFAAYLALFGVLGLIPPVRLWGGVRVFEPPTPLPLAFARYVPRSVVQFLKKKFETPSVLDCPHVASKPTLFCPAIWESLLAPVADCWHRKPFSIMVNDLGE